MTTVEMIDQMLDRLTPGTDNYYWCEAIKARVESEHLAIARIVVEAADDYGQNAHRGDAILVAIKCGRTMGAREVYDAIGLGDLIERLNVIAEKTGVTHGE